jgi:hypothetical protein
MIIYGWGWRLWLDVEVEYQKWHKVYTRLDYFALKRRLFRSHLILEPSSFHNLHRTLATSQPHLPPSPAGCSCLHIHYPVHASLPCDLSNFGRRAAAVRCWKDHGNRTETQDNVEPVTQKRHSTVSKDQKKKEDSRKAARDAQCVDAVSRATILVMVLRRQAVGMTLLSFSPLHLLQLVVKSQ